VFGSSVNVCVCWMCSTSRVSGVFCEPEWQRDKSVCVYTELCVILLWKCVVRRTYGSNLDHRARTVLLISVSFLLSAPLLLCFGISISNTGATLCCFYLFYKQMTQSFLLFGFSKTLWLIPWVRVHQLSSFTFTSHSLSLWRSKTFKMCGNMQIWPKSHDIWPD